MPTLEETNYTTARDQIEIIIKDSSAKTKKHLETIVQYRSKIMLGLMSEWVSTYQSEIRHFSEYIDFAETQEKLGDALSRYMNYTFMYRFLNGLENNILFHKVVSFEMHFFSYLSVLCTKENIDFDTPSDLSDDENLFYLNPLGHFFFFRILKEYHVTPRSDLVDVVKRQRLYDMLLHTVRISLTDFFSEYTDCTTIQLDDFRNFIKRPNNKNLNSVFKRIEERPYSV